jgi:hypothetical protein
MTPFAAYMEASSFQPSLSVLTSAADILEAWCNAEDVAYDAYFRLGPTGVPSSVMLDFCEKATFLAKAGTEGEVDGEETNSKAFAAIKGSVINGVIGLSSTIPGSQEVFWSRMQRWLVQPDRDDLQCCALLSYGNRARGDASAIELLSGGSSILPAILQVLRAGTTAQVLHSVVGLLRNLSIPEANKVLLGETDLLDELVELGVWSTEKDMLGSVQGGAVGIVKNLCRSNREWLDLSRTYSLVHNAVQLAAQPRAVNEILNLLQRTDDPAIKFEATRVFVNCVRSVCGPGILDDNVLPTFSNAAIVSAMIDMFKESGPYPVLANESVIALALLATFSSSAVCEFAYLLS